jgi:hypothetical protein
MTRYNFMKQSPTQYDSTDNAPYPDPLSIKWNNFTVTVPPTQVLVDDTMIRNPFLITYAVYGDSSYDDIVSMINKTPHISLLVEDDTIYYPDVADITAFAGKPS